MDKLNAQVFGKFKNSPIILFFIIALVTITLAKSIVVVEAGKRVAVFNSFTGVEKRTLREGMHLLVPYIQTPISYSVRTNTYTMSSQEGEGESIKDDALNCLTADGQKIRIDLSLRYNLLPEEIWQIHQEVGPDYLDKIIRPGLRSIVRNTISNYPVVQVYSGKRQVIQDEIEQKTKEALAKYHINASEILIRNVTFTDEFAKAVEMKQVALQDSERMRYILEKEKQEKQRKIIEAEGEAEAIRRKAAALKANPQLIQYEYVSKIAPGVKTIITNQNSIMNLPSEMFNK
ncbi:MAG: hypothetical protein A2287_02945 [Candidatus Melainabacteria bacterium RIFOXYA12_FULL_32_12]|nr:MAG: hypothetical protein A2104_00165 [Candidatus Melainabacteria bacterium GWF2_32_7]OGI17073.1 MAG: hypothetical protein A2255_06755 [Candidatus Melainabacteria bacterium RIFOXYA2_FULL_32_9]OGI29351.1 MAG: hypothetical protein A2287_02945 [Candidatus Melainabacteria bacterium RIFOXYA12_FULL_32_12]